MQRHRGWDLDALDLLRDREGRPVGRVDRVARVPQRGQRKREDADVTYDIIPRPPYTVTKLTNATQTGAGEAHDDYYPTATSGYGTYINSSRGVHHAGAGVHYAQSVASTGSPR